MYRRRSHLQLGGDGSQQGGDRLNGQRVHRVDDQIVGKTDETVKRAVCEVLYPPIHSLQPTYEIQIRTSFHDLPIFRRSVRTVIAAHKLTTAKLDETVRLHCAITIIQSVGRSQS